MFSVTRAFLLFRVMLNVGAYRKKSAVILFSTTMQKDRGGVKMLEEPYVCVKTMFSTIAAS